MSDQHDPASTIRFPESPIFLHVRREAISILVLETEHCPHVMPRIWSILSSRNILPFTIATRRDEQMQSIAIELATPSEKQARSVLHDLRRVVNIRRVNILVPAERSATNAIRAKF